MTRITVFFDMVFRKIFRLFKIFIICRSVINIIYDLSRFFDDYKCINSKDSFIQRSAFSNRNPWILSR